MSRRASVKDVVESCGVPHTEIGCLKINAHEVDFSSLVEEQDIIEITGVHPPVNVGRDTLLRQGFPKVRFAVDANVGKLSSLLRMAGLNTFYEPTLKDADLAEVCEQQKRILLTRDRVLLMRKNVEHGRFIRSGKPEEQLAEVVELYGMSVTSKPFSRCLVCNNELVMVEKEDILYRLEPLTKKYYHSFKMCRACDKVYWAGSHREKMERLLKKTNQ